MPLFAIVAFDAPNSRTKRMEYLKAHVEILAAMKKEGRLFAAGPLRESMESTAEDIGSILIINFDSQTEAESWFKDEPYCKAGVYKTVMIKPYLDAMNFISSYN